MVNWIGLGRAMSRLSVSTYVEFHQATNHTFDPYMPIVIVGALLGGIVLAILSRGIHSLSGELGIAGSVCYAAVIAIALATDGIEGVVGGLMEFDIGRYREARHCAPKPYPVDHQPTSGQCSEEDDDQL